MRTVFLARDLFAEADSLARQLQKKVNEISKAPGGDKLRLHLQPTGPEGKTVNKSKHLDDLKRDLRFTRPHAVCPKCKGAQKPLCKGCSGAGWVDESVWNQLKGVGAAK
jgi:hypothetical protein